MKLRVRIYDCLRFWLPTLSAVFVGQVIAIGRFRGSAPKAENGFVARRIVSSPEPDETQLKKDQ
jgi:hypothetical protein